MKTKACLALVVALITALMSSVAFADAREHFRRGQAAYQQGNYDLAITEWLAGYQVEQRPEFQYNLAQAYERLGRLQDAVVSLQAFVGSADPDDSSYSDATARLASLQQRLALTGVRISGGQDGATIFVDGRDWGRLPRPDKISVSPGSHQIIIKLAGFKDFVSTVVTPAGQVIDLEITMEPGVGTTGAPPVPATPPPQGWAAGPSAAPTAQPGAQPVATLPMTTVPARKPRWIYMGIGIGAGVVALGSFIGYAERSAQVTKCEMDDNFCSELDAVRGQRTLWGASTLIFGLVAAGSFVLFAIDKETSEPTTLACAPGLMGGSCRLTF